MNDTISFSDSAKFNAQKLASMTENKDYGCLRVYIEGKGCDGFYYGVSFDHFDPKTDIQWPLNEKLSVVTDKDSLPFLTGAHIDWIDDERGQGFLVDNPKQKEFRGKFYKRQKWVDKLTKTDA